VNSVAYSPDSKYVLTGSGDSTTTLWDAHSGAKVRTLSGQTDVVTSVAFSPDASTVLTGSDDTTAILWNVQSGARVRTFSGHTGAVWSVVFSPNGEYVLTGSIDETAILWDAETGGGPKWRAGANFRRNTATDHTDFLTGAAFSPNGKHVPTGSNDGLAIQWKRPPIS
jgi:WD40 repeat protein